jgi:hypothetical protein
MNIVITVNLWFVVSLCLAFALIGVVIGVRSANRGERQHNRHYQELPPLHNRY